MTNDVAPPAQTGGAEKAATGGAETMTGLETVSEHPDAAIAINSILTSPGVAKVTLGSRLNEVDGEPPGMVHTYCKLAPETEIEVALTNRTVSPKQMELAVKFATGLA